MKKILIILILTLFLISCSVEEVPEADGGPEVQENADEAVEKKLCSEEEIDFLISNIETKIEPRPNQARREYDSGYVEFSILNKEKDINGYFNLSVECVMQGKTTKEYESINLQQGDRKEVKIMCSERGTILSINGPIVVSAPMKEVCD